MCPIKAKKLIEIDETTISIKFFNKKLLDFESTVNRVLAIISCIR